MLNYSQCLQTKLERHSNKSVLFGKFCVKLLATFTSKTRKHNFRKACHCLLCSQAFFHRQPRIYNKKRELRQRTKQKWSDEGIQGELDRTDIVTRRPILPLCTLYCQRELAKSRATKHSFYKMIFHARARNVTVTAVPSFLPHEQWEIFEHLPP